MRMIVFGIMTVSLLTAFGAPLAALEAASERAAVTATALDYIEGYFSGDAERMARALHPELTKVIVMPPQNGMNSYTRKMTATELVEITRSKRGVIPKDQWGIETTVLDIDGDMAMVKIVNPKFIDYVQLAKVEGAWKIVKVLWGIPPGK